jgi:hypothetical protein
MLGSKSINSLPAFSPNQAAMHFRCDRDSHVEELIALVTRPVPPSLKQ